MGGGRRAAGGERREASANNRKVAAAEGVPKIGLVGWLVGVGVFSQFYICLIYP